MKVVVFELVSWGFWDWDEKEEEEIGLCLRLAFLKLYCTLGIMLPFNLLIILKIELVSEFRFYYFSSFLTTFYSLAFKSRISLNVYPISFN